MKRPYNRRSLGQEALQRKLEAGKDRTVAVSVYFPPGEFVAVRDAAHKLRLSISFFMRMVADSWIRDHAK
jgi:hypothetical protein